MHALGYTLYMTTIWTLAGAQTPSGRFQWSHEVKSASIGLHSVLAVAALSTITDSEKRTVVQEFSFFVCGCSHYEMPVY